MDISIETIYEILIKWANNNTAKTYTDLSSEYQEKTGIWLEPHGSWDKPLGELANILFDAGYPPLTALVVLKGKNEPGNDFWGCAPNVPKRPKNENERLTEWIRMTNDCYSCTWASKL